VANRDPAGDGAGDPRGLRAWWVARASVCAALETLAPTAARECPLRDAVAHRGHGGPCLRPGWVRPGLVRARAPLVRQKGRPPERLSPAQACGATGAMAAMGRAAPAPAECKTRTADSHHEAGGHLMGTFRHTVGGEGMNTGARGEADTHHAGLAGGSVKADVHPAGGLANDGLARGERTSALGAEGPRFKSGRPDHMQAGQAAFPQEPVIRSSRLPGMKAAVCPAVLRASMKPVSISHILLSWCVSGVTSPATLM
jgi:hypothetical protein